MKRFLPYLISALAITAMFGGAVYASTPAFTSSQLSTTTPTPGNILETDGSGNHWIANTASGSTLITAGAGISTTTSTGGAVTVTNTGVTSLTAGTNITLSGSTGGVTINASGGGGTGTVSTSTHEIAGEVPYWTSNSGTPALLGQVATSSLGAGTGLTFSGTAGSQIGGTNGTFSVNTTQNITTLSNLTSGFVQAASGVLSSAALTSAQITTALGFTPSSFAFPFTSTSYGVSTTTTIGFLNGLLDTASTTFTSSPQFNSLFAMSVNPDGTAADAFNFGGRPSVGIPVPYVRPTQSNQNIAFDIFPNGTPGNGFGNNIYGVAWEDICSTDIFAGPDYECLHLGKALNGASNVSSSQGGNGLIQPLAFQLFGGNTGVGTDTPYAYFAITASTTAGKPNEPLFAIASSSTDVIVTNRGLVGIGTPSPTAALTLAAGSTINSTGNLTLTSLAANSLTVDSGTTGTLNIGNSANAKTINIGNATVATKVGIASTTPYGQFSINPTINNGVNPSLVVGSSTGTDFIILNNGNVGIGSTSPTDLLDVAGNIHDTGLLGIGVGCDNSILVTNVWTGCFGSPVNGQNIVTLERASNNVNNLLQFVPTGANTPTNVNWTMGTLPNSDSFSFGAYNGTLVNQYFSIADSGNVGIGTTTAWGQLSASSTSAYPTLAINQHGTGNAAILIGGNVGIGTTTPTAVFVSQAASTTAGTVQTPYVGVVAMITGLENTTLKIFFEIDQWGHQITSGDTPSVSGGTSSVAGNDNNGNITVTGTALTSVVLTFAHPWTAAPDCVTSDNSLTFQSDPTSISATAMTIGFTAGVTTGTVWYQCRQHQ